MITFRRSAVEEERATVVEGLASLLRDSELSADDLRFITVIVTMAMAVKPAKFFEQLRTVGASVPTIGETSPLPRTADPTAGTDRKLSREAIAVIDEATAQGNKSVLALMATSQNAMPSRDVLEAELGREALDKVSCACFLHDANDRTT